MHLSLSRNTALHKLAGFLLSTEVHSSVGLPDSACPPCKAPSLALRAVTRKCFHSDLGRDVGVLVVIASGVVISMWAPERGCFQRGGFSQLREGGGSGSQALEGVWQLEPYFAYLGIQLCPDSACVRKERMRRVGGGGRRGGNPVHSEALLRTSAVSAGQDPNCPREI